jgi:hypothetical protein
MSPEEYYKKGKLSVRVGDILDEEDKSLGCGTLKFPQCKVAHERFGGTCKVCGKWYGDKELYDSKILICSGRQETTDNVNSPKHYSLNHKGIECIDAMEAALTPEEFKGYLRGNVIKYVWRFRYKNGLEDLKKAQWYLNKLIATEEKGV